MLITVDMMKAALGLPVPTTPPDPALDAKLEQASILAQTLVESYIGGPLEATMQSWELFDVCFQHRLFLPHHPILTVLSVVKDGIALDPDTGYRVDKKMGALVFQGCSCWRGCSCGCYWAATLGISYTSGFDPVPADLMAALLNIALSIYENGGTLTASSNEVGALKSMTMFDAMSMSFETSGVEASSMPNTLLKETWGVVLNKYRMEYPVMA
jgi:hypothetical protein